MNIPQGSHGPSRQQGGSTTGQARRSRLIADQTFIAIEKIIGGNTREILEAAFKGKVNPSKMGKERALDKVCRANADKMEPIPDEVALKEVRGNVEM